MAEEKKQLNTKQQIDKTKDSQVKNNPQNKNVNPRNTNDRGVAQAKKSPFRGNKKRGYNAKAGGQQDELEQRIIDIARVTRVMAGGKRMRFRACVAVGNRKNKVAIGLAKGADVTAAIAKAVNQAKKDIINVPIVNDTIPHEIFQKFGAAKILFKPASKGRGIIAGGAIRIVIELSGIKNITSKILGTNNKVSNVKCTIKALRSFKKIAGNKDPKEIKPNKK